MTLIELTGRVNDQGQLEFDQPENLPPQEVKIIMETSEPKAKKPRKSGNAQGLVKMADNFDAPLEDFNDYASY